MRAFLQSLDEKVWQAVKIGWTKPKEAPADWDEAKIKVANFNSGALNAIFSAVTNEEFKKISSIETAKEAWTILQTTYEGTKAIKDSKLHRLTTSFKEIKITAIEESKDIDKIPLTELVGNLQTYELGLSRIGKSGKGKSLPLKAKSSDTDESSNDEDSKMKSYITRQFKKFMKNANGEELRQGL